MVPNAKEQTDNCKAKNPFIFLGSFLAVSVAVVILIAAAARFLGNLDTSSATTQTETSFATISPSRPAGLAQNLVPDRRAYSNNYEVTYNDEEAANNSTLSIQDVSPPTNTQDDLFARLQDAEFRQTLTLEKIATMPEVETLSMADRKKFFNEVARKLSTGEIDRTTFAGPDGKAVVASAPPTPLPTLQEAMAKANGEEIQNYQAVRRSLDELYAGAPHTAKELMAMQEVKGMSQELSRVLAAEVQEKLRKGEIDVATFLDQPRKGAVGAENPEPVREKMP